MRSTPAVSLACRDGGAWRVAVAGLHGLAAAVLLAWLGGPAWALLSLPVMGLAWRRGETTAPVLAWDGRAWLLDGAAGRPTVALDLGVWLLLRFDVDGGRRHWLPASAAAGHWTAWRAALMASAGPGAAGPDTSASRAS